MGETVAIADLLAAGCSSVPATLVLRAQARPVYVVGGERLAPAFHHLAMQQLFAIPQG